MSFQNSKFKANRQTALTLLKQFGVGGVEVHRKAPTPTTRSSSDFLDNIQNPQLNEGYIPTALHISVVVIPQGVENTPELYELRGQKRALLTFEQTTDDARLQVGDRFELAEHGWLVVKSFDAINPDGEYPIIYDCNVGG